MFFKEEYGCFQCWGCCFCPPSKITISEEDNCFGAWNAQKIREGKSDHPGDLLSSQPNTGCPRAFFLGIKREFGVTPKLFPQL